MPCSLRFTNSYVVVLGLLKYLTCLLCMQTYCGFDKTNVPRVLSRLPASSSKKSQCDKSQSDTAGA